VAKRPGAMLVGLAINNVRNSASMFCEPLPHFRDAPFPLEGMGIQVIVFWPGRIYVIGKVASILPRSALEVVKLEGVQQQLGLIEPGGVDRVRHECHHRPNSAK
jgi:hypothetical protein